MNKCIKCCYIIIVIFKINNIGYNLTAQDTIHKEINKKGWSFGGIPALAYNTDNGFLYGVIGDIFNFGDGSSYPNYKFKTRIEVDRTTKGNQILAITSDFREILPYRMRVTFDIESTRQNMLPFFGFNGYDANYNASYIDQDKSQYISRAYYTMQRSLDFATCDLQGFLLSTKIKWLAGIGYMNFDLKPVNIDKINKGMDEVDKLPNVPSLYEKYINEGIISQNDKSGGEVSYIKTGLIYDTRDNEPNPNKGLWVEAVFLSIPGWLGNDWKFGQMSIIFRHYHTIVPSLLSFANRIGYQKLIYGEKPFYMLPFLFTSFRTRDFLGGVKTVRGVILNRVQGNSMLFGNIEMRYKFLKFNLFDQNFYLANNTFVDWGIVTDKYPINANLSQLSLLEIENNREKLHIGVGSGMKIALNQNFIVSVEFAKAINKNDGNTAIYIDLDFLF
jgi:hypothetical protein